MNRRTSPGSVIDRRRSAATMEGMDWFKWTPFIEYKFWGLVVMGVLAFIGGWMGWLNGSPREGERSDREADQTRR